MEERTVHLIREENNAMILCNLGNTVNNTVWDRCSSWVIRIINDYYLAMLISRVVQNNGGQ